MIHRFNDLGMRSLDPQWAGGRPRQITTTDRELIVTTAKTRPTNVGSAVHALVDPQTRRVPRDEEGPQGDGRPRTAASDPDRGGDHVPADQDVEGITRPVEGREAGADRVAASNMPVTARSRSTSSVRSRSNPSAGRRGRRAASPNGCERTITSRTGHGSSTRGTRSAPISSTARSNRARDPRRRCARSKRSGRSVDDGEPIHVILDNLNHHKNRDRARLVRREHTSSSCSPRPTRRGRTRSRRTSGRYASSSSRTATTPTIPRSAERSASTSAGGTATPATHESSTPNVDTEPASAANNNADGATHDPPPHNARTFVVRALAARFTRARRSPSRSGVILRAPDGSSVRVVCQVRTARSRHWSGMPS